jgi:hypothetical protein
VRLQQMGFPDPEIIKIKVRAQRPAVFTNVAPSPAEQDW